MRWLICYDIEKNNNRRRAFRVLKQGSLGYQKSGFEQGLTPNPLAVLTDLQNHLEETDRLLVLPRLQPHPNWQLGQGVTTSNKLLLVFN